MKKIIIVLALLLVFTSLPTYEAANFGSFGALTVSADFKFADKDKDDANDDNSNDSGAESNQQEEITPPQETPNQSSETSETGNNTNTGTEGSSGGSGGSSNSDTSSSGSSGGKTPSSSGSNSNTSNKKTETAETQDSPAGNDENSKQEAEVIEDPPESEIPVAIDEQEMVTVADSIGLEKPDSGMSAFPIILIIISIILIALIIIFCILLGRKSKEPKREAILMKLEMISAKGEPNGNEFFLEDELTIGRGKSCDMIIDSDDIEMKHSRIYVNNGVVYIEDLKSRSGTLLGGMRLYAPNRLRTGDEITIGSVRFRFKF
ncbi:MAG: FHA domain-containing protein [Clostridia bacterium]|nr:FHA domain-containing protein [Clostridia bacterium]